MNYHVSTPDMFLHNEDKLGMGGPVWHGAAVAWHDNLLGTATTIESDHNRYSAVRFAHGGK